MRCAAVEAVQGRAGHRPLGSQGFPWFPKAGDGQTENRRAGSSFRTVSLSSFFKSSFYLEITVDSHVIVGHEQRDPGDRLSLVATASKHTHVVLL